VPEVRKDILGTEKNNYSQHGEEVIIRDFFQDKRDGFFLDVGCAWPVENSNTYYLESRLGWRGIGIDALADYGPRWLKRRPKSLFFTNIVTDHSGTFETFYRTEDGELLGISTLTPGGPGRAKVAYREVQVPTITLNDLLDQNGVPAIDLLSMDIEGAETLALAGFDIERFKPALAVVEVHADTGPPILEYFAAHGYEKIERYSQHDYANYYFARAEVRAAR
jgi:FkbM family methyltransferase